MFLSSISGVASAPFRSVRLGEEHFHLLGLWNSGDGLSCLVLLITWHISLRCVDNAGCSCHKKHIKKRLLSMARRGVGGVKGAGCGGGSFMGMPSGQRVYMVVKSCLNDRENFTIQFPPAPRTCFPCSLSKLPVYPIKPRHKRNFRLHYKMGLYESYKIFILLKNNCTWIYIYTAGRKKGRGKGELHEYLV